MFHLAAHLPIVMAVLAALAVLVIGAYVVRVRKRQIPTKQTSKKNNLHEEAAHNNAAQKRPPLERMDGKALDTIEKEIIPEHAKIVGVIPPVGPWTRMVFSEKIGYIMDKLNGKETNGYWVKLVQMQKRGLGQNNRHKR